MSALPFLLSPDVAQARPLPAQPNPRAATLGMALLREGLVSGDGMVQALAQQALGRGRLTDILLSRGLIAPDQLYAGLARQWGTNVIDPQTSPPDVRLIDRLGADYCLRHSVLPWHSAGSVTIVATAQPEDFLRHHDHLTALFGPVAMAIAPAAAIDATLLAMRGNRLARSAETRVRAADSCRHLGGDTVLRPLVVVALLALAVMLIWPLALGWLLLGWAVATLILTTLLKIAAALAARARPRQIAPPPLIARLPTVSVMVALFHESDIAPRLIRRLSRLDYPRELLDIVLVVEEEDATTRTALTAANLPSWMRQVVVPGGRVKTKPRALNFALDHCRGSIIGVYDAEDAPEPDQITRIVQRFYQRGPEVACLQGVLDFYNPTTNWLSRCFTIEYASWFRLILPGLQRLGLPVPLGGTTVFFRRDALEKVGGWDAHNVTEDADLGMRLYRYGYRTEVIDTVTGEEANCRTLPWVRQRSRWLKGYMMTWATHMRDPRQLLRQLGWWRFAGFQVLFLGTLSQFLLAPLLWSFWLTWLDVPHPLADALPPMAFLALIALFALSEITNIALGITALHLSGHRLSRWWVVSMHVYFPLGALASYKAAWELVCRPFFWDKTAHGQFDPLD
ncbi:MAG: glycosyltransferase [Rhodobacteraceae bacterium]|nr:glycosyltransferase [Paracoccaceae bacterium]